MGATDGMTIDEVLRISFSDRPLSAMVSNFASIMDYKLNKNVEKKGSAWKDTPFHVLFDRLLEEVDELGRAMASEEEVVTKLVHEDDATRNRAAAAVVLECADVANFVLFIAERMLNQHVDAIKNRFITQGWWTPDEDSRIMMYRDTMTNKVYFADHPKSIEANLPILPDWVKINV